MSVVVKLLWKSLIQKKTRTLLVLFSIAVSSAMIFANEGFKATVAHMFYEADTRHAGNSSLIITTKLDVGAKEWIDTELLKSYSNRMIYANSFIREHALYAPNLEDMYYYQIYGVDMKEFQQHNPFDLKEGDYGEWSGYQIVMGELYANKYDISVGDTMTLEMNGKNYNFKVAGIAKQEGIYMRELADGGTLFAPKETIAKIFGGEANLTYIKEKDPEQLQKLYEDLQDTFKDYNVTYTIDPNLIKAETTNYVLPFRISSVAVIFMSMFIIFTGYGLIINERISSLGTLRSLGLTRRRMGLILILESAAIGIFGGLLGCGLGRVILTVLKDLYFKNNGTFTTSGPIMIGSKELITTIITAVVITCLSAVGSIQKTTKLQIKEIILHRTEQKVARDSKLWSIGAFLFVACLLLPRFLPVNLTGMITGDMLATGALVGSVFMIPTIVWVITKVAESCGLPQEVCLGIRNTRDSKTLANNLKLFSAMIAIVAFMVTIFHTMSYDLHDAWDHKNLFDVSFTLRESKEDSLSRIYSVDGVTKAIAYYANYECEMIDKNVFLNTLYGIEDIDFFDINVVGDLDKAHEAVKHLKDGKNVITTTILKEKLGLKLGDNLRISYSGRTEEYKITGFIDTNIGIGHVAYIAGENYRSFIGTTNYDTFMVQGNVKPEDLKLRLKREFTKDILTIETKEELKKANADKVDSIFNAINLYTYLAVAVGMLGMTNNIVAGFIERKQSLALYRCIGMSRKGISRMLLTEAVTLGVIGSTMGLVTAFTMMNTIPQVVGLMWGKVAPRPATVEIVILCLAGLLTMLAMSIIPLRGSRNISIMESMKYE